MTTDARNTRTTIIPCLHYRDAPVAIGSDKHAIYCGAIDGTRKYPYSIFTFAHCEP